MTSKSVAPASSSAPRGVSPTTRNAAHASRLSGAWIGCATRTRPRTVVRITVGSTSGSRAIARTSVARAGAAPRTSSAVETTAMPTRITTHAAKNSKPKS